MLEVAQEMLRLRGRLLPARARLLRARSAVLRARPAAIAARGAGADRVPLPFCAGFSRTRHRRAAVEPPAHVIAATKIMEFITNTWLRDFRFSACDIPPMQLLFTRTARQRTGETRLALGDTSVAVANKVRKAKTKAPGQVAIIVGGRIKYIDRPGHQAQKATPVPKRARPKRSAAKIDPKYLAAARELRERYLEQFNSGLVLPGGKYEVSRALLGADAAPAPAPAQSLELQAA